MFSIGAEHCGYRYVSLPRNALALRSMGGIYLTKLEDVGVRVRLDEIENDFDRLNARLDELERAVADIRALGRDFWRAEAAVLLTGSEVRSWHYSASDRNTMFPDVFACERPGSSEARRWVGTSGELATTLAISRSERLVFSVHMKGFATPELRSSLRLEVDGSELVWCAKDGDTWSAIVPADPGNAKLAFRLFVDRTLLPDDKDVSFSFSELRLEPASESDLDANSAIIPLPTVARADTR
jgi:hypothetical protein